MHTLMECISNQLEAKLRFTLKTIILQVYAHKIFMTQFYAKS